MAEILTKAEIKQRVADALLEQQSYFGFLGGYSQAARTVSPDSLPIEWLAHQQQAAQTWIRENTSGKLEFNALGELGDAAGATFSSTQKFATAEVSTLAAAISRIPVIDSHIYENFNDATIDKISDIVAIRYQAFVQEEARLRTNPEPTWGQSINAFLSFAMDWLTGNTQGRNYNDYVTALVATDVVENRFERTRDFAVGLRRELESMTINGEPLGAHIAEFVSKVDEHGRFIDANPVYVDASDTDLLKQIKLEQQRTRPTTGDLWKAALSGDTRAIVSGGLIAVLGTAAATTALDNRLTRGTAKLAWGTGKFTLGALEGVGHGMRDLAFTARMATDSITGLPSTGRTTGQIGKFFDALETRASAGKAYRAGRGLSRFATFAGFIPLAGGVAVSGINLVLYNEAAASGKLNTDQLATLRTILLADSAAGFGGFLADGASTANIEAHRALMDPNDPLQEFLPATLVSLAQEALTEHDGQTTLSTIEQAQSIIRYRDNHLSSYGGDHNFAWETGNLDGLVKAWIGMAETTPIYTDFEKNPYSQNPAMQALYSSYKENPYGRESFTEFLHFAVNQNLMSTLNLIQKNLHVPNRYMSEATLFYDLSNHGPAYQRLLEHALQKGLTLHEFDTEVIRTLGSLSRNIVNDDTPNLSNDRAAQVTLAVLPPNAFGGGLGNLIVIPSESELAAYNTSRGEGYRSETASLYTAMTNQLNADVARSEKFVLDRLDAYIELDLQSGNFANISKERLVHALHNNDVLTAWAEKKPDQYQAFVLAVNDESISVEDTIELLQPDYVEFSKTEDAQKIYTRVSSELQGQQGQTYEQLVALIIGDGTNPEKVMQDSLNAIEMALLLPENLSSTTAELQALLDASAKLRSSFAAIPADSETITAEHVAYYTALQQMSEAMRSYRGIEQNRAKTMLTNNTIQAGTGADEVKGGAAADTLVEETEEESLQGDIMPTENKQFAALITDQVVASGNRAAVISGTTPVAIHNRTAFAGGTLDVKGILPECVSGGRDSCATNSKVASDAPVQIAEAGDSTDLGLSAMFRA